MRPLAWIGLDEQRFELAFVATDGGLKGHGTQLAPDYRLSYEVETDQALVTERFAAECENEHGSRRVELRRGRDLGAKMLDVDLAFSPLFNSLPVLRDRLLTGGASRTYEMAFVDVPTLDVSPSTQEYLPLRQNVVRFRTGGFSADIRFDDDGFVVEYPQLARRL